MMPIHHIHLAMILALAVVTAGVVYLYLATGKSDSPPLKIAGVVLLAIVVVNSAVYIIFYSFMFGRMNTMRGQHSTLSQTPVMQSMPAGEQGEVPGIQPDAIPDSESAAAQ